MYCLITRVVERALDSGVYCLELAMLGEQSSDASRVDDIPPRAYFDLVPVVGGRERLSISQLIVCFLGRIPDSLLG